jgi:hypothetical protein
MANPMGMSDRKATRTRTKRMLENSIDKFRKDYLVESSQNGTLLMW